MTPEKVIVQLASKPPQETRKTKPVSVLKMFSLATPMELFFFFIGMLGAAGNGGSMPAMIFLLGRIVDDMGSNANFMQNMQLLCVEMWCYFCVCQPSEHVLFSLQ